MFIGIIVIPHIMGEYKHIRLDVLWMKLFLNKTQPLITSVTKCTKVFKCSMKYYPLLLKWGIYGRHVNVNKP